MLADDRDWLGRRDVVARRPVVLPIGSLEVFLDDLLPPRESVATAHGKIMADHRCASRFTNDATQEDGIIQPMAKKRVFLDECVSDLGHVFGAKAHVYTARDLGVRGKEDTRVIEKAFTAKVPHRDG